MSQTRARFNRVHSREFKVSVVQRVLNGESIAEMAKELGIWRKLIYEWKDQYQQCGEAGFRLTGRPSGKGAQAVPAAPSATVVEGEAAGGGELAAARTRIQELERKVGQQELELDFFGEALRRIRAAKKDGEQRSTTSSPSKPSKAKAD